MERNNKVKIFVCCHKPAKIPNNSVYVPLHIGRAVSTCKEQMQNYVGDDSGDNISARNKHYSEATGIYWIWKNVNDCDYVGLIQYRRNFAVEFSDENIDSFFVDGTDVILAENYPRVRTRWHTVLTYMQMEDFIIMQEVIKKMYPEYLSTLNRFLRDYLDHPFNMVVCRKELYNKYAEWLFSICFEMEKYIRYSDYSNSSRLFGYVTELLTPIYFIHNSYRIKTIPVIWNSGGNVCNSTKARLFSNLMHHIIWRFRKDSPISIDQSFYRGLEQDGIKIR